MGLRRRRVRMRSCLIVCAFCIGMGLLMLSLRTVDSPPNPTDVDFPVKLEVEEESSGPVSGGEAEEEEDEVVVVGKRGGKSETERSCATVEEMGKAFHGGFRNESLRVRRIIQDHFALYGASRVRSLPPEQFCRHGFVMGKSSEAGFGNEMYKVLTGAALSIMLNRSLIIGQTRHIGRNILLAITFLTRTTLLP
ncbi:hypothetical protein CMV_003508 [Castanea mollissima]|uniref:Uncharacterized protein n=1 Tax=Castanea mollissima TaxID=60419 RepID=A0A8J4S094_9ROSI|nr:hypothetical protein CMV_003508 [Castanea mollissima]